MTRATAYLKLLMTAPPWRVKPLLTYAKYTLTENSSKSRDDAAYKTAAAREHVVSRSASVGHDMVIQRAG
jgi:hypothetical protein